MTNTVEKTTLDNGVRVVTERIDYVQSVSLGVWAMTGSRYEKKSRRGISHFLEHMVFKGTERRPTAKHIADEVDAIGGYLNAFTDKEYTCYDARALSEHLPLVLDILADMYMNSAFDAEEMDREKKVVLEEIKQRDDDPEDLVHDLFGQTLWKKHPLGLPVIGESRVIEALTPQDLRDYMAHHYGPDGIIVSVAGQLEHSAVVDLARETFGRLKGVSKQPEHYFPKMSVDSLLQRKQTEQVNFCVGMQGCSQMDEDKYAVAIIDLVLGGCMGTRLFQEIREKRGLAYSIGSMAAAYREGGMFVAYGGTSPDTYEECLDVIRQEFASLRANGITHDELSRAKNQFRGSKLLAQESMSSHMHHMAVSEIYFNRVIPVDETLAAINAVTEDDIRRVAASLFPSEDALTIAAVGPFHKGSGRNKPPKVKNKKRARGARHGKRK